MGKYGQYVSVIPSKNIVMIRMGENPSSVAVPFLFLDDICVKLKLLINQEVIFSGGGSFFPVYYFLFWLSAFFFEFSSFLERSWILRAFYLLSQF
jgi:hypothetical protein